MEVRKRKSGFTLIEIVVVMTILMILFAIIFPVLTSCKQSSKLTSNISRMHQIYKAAMIYQGDHGGGGICGDLVAMGLPTSWDYNLHYFNLPREVTRSACGPRPANLTINKDGTFVYGLMMGEDAVIDAVRKHQGAFPFLIDVECNTPDIDIYNTYHEPFVMAITLDGRIVKKKGRGFSFGRHWKFLCPPDGEGA